MRSAVNGMFYVARTGYQWDNLLHGHRNHNSVYDHHRKWCWGGTWQRINATLREQVRQTAGRDRQPSAAIVDSQSAKITDVGDAVSGIVLRSDDLKGCQVLPSAGLSNAPSLG
jgi:putative transposase